MRDELNLPTLRATQQSRRLTEAAQHCHLCGQAVMTTKHTPPRPPRVCHLTSPTPYPFKQMA